MKIGKREQIVILVVIVAAIIMVAHLIVFSPRAESFAQVEKRFQDEVAKVQQLGIPRSEEALNLAAVETKNYQDQISSLVVTLNLDVDPKYTSIQDAEFQSQLDDTVALMRQLVQLSTTLKNVRLTFLEDQRIPYGPYRVQMGWDIPKQLPTIGVEGGLSDTIGKIRGKASEMASQGASDRIQNYYQYNQLMKQIGLDPAETEVWFVMYGQQPIYFSEEKLATDLRTPSGQNRMQLQPTANDFIRLLTPNVPGQATAQVNAFQLQAAAGSLAKSGVLVPELKKLWVAELIWEKAAETLKIDKAKLREVLGVKFPKDESVLAVNKQLRALIDLAVMADKTGIAEISQVNLLKPASFGKAVERIPGQTPTPKPTVAAQAAMGYGGAAMFGDPGMGGDPAMMGMGDPMMMGGGMGGGMGMAMQPQATPVVDKIGSGTGIEVYFRGNHASTIQYLFDVTNKPRTYSLDDLYIAAQPDGQLNTSTTVEMVYILHSLLN